MGPSHHCRISRSCITCRVGGWRSRAYSSLRTRGLILSGPCAFRGSSLHKSLLIPAEVIVMQSIGLYGGGSRRDVVSLSVVGVTFENTDDILRTQMRELLVECLSTRSCIPRRCHQLGWVSLSCHASCA